MPRRRKQKNRSAKRITVNVNVSNANDTIRMPNDSRLSPTKPTSCQTSTPPNTNQISHNEHATRAVVVVQGTERNGDNGVAGAARGGQRQAAGSITARREGRIQSTWWVRRGMRQRGPRRRAVNARRRMAGSEAQAAMRQARNEKRGRKNGRRAAGACGNKEAGQVTEGREKAGSGCAEGVTYKIGYRRTPPSTTATTGVHHRVSSRQQALLRTCRTTTQQRAPRNTRTRRRPHNAKNITNQTVTIRGSRTNRVGR